ncbi:MAG TPA: protein kinase [Kofleriaceae bacterium]|jgi:serine/threonine protein kinase/tetratricopeptide (TPR) repeat protein
MERLSDGRFELLETLGEGGMGVVHRALDRERGVQVALKKLRGPTPDGVLRFKTEFRALRDIRHPNLVELGELFESDGTWAFTMELVRGVPLLAWARGNAGPSPDSTDPELTVDEGPRAHDVITDVHGDDEADATLIEAPDVPVRPPRVDEARLRKAFSGLASGLVALHAAGKVHRDVKPSNVLVDEQGRAVLLDFGVVAELGGAGDGDKQIIGTVNYMAPEQARGDAVGPAADWYAFGVVLYEALAGRLPLAASTRALLVLKQHTPAPELTRFVDAPPDLATLCMRLLDRDPVVRPSEAEIFEALGVPKTVQDARWLPAATEGTLFVGRRMELGALETALDASKRAPVAVVIEGESGVGKTALVDHFCEVVRATRKRAVILHGRCHQRERVAFNAFDGVVHDLARWLIARPDARAAQLVPSNASELVAVFPDLRAVPMFAAATSGLAGAPASADLRDRAFGALRDLLVAIAARGPVVLAIDDLQWADDDSRSLLESLLRERRTSGKPRDSLLVIATLRAGESVPELARDTRTIALGGLAPIDAELLLKHLTERRGAEVAHVIEESGGHPLFLAELVRHREITGAPPRLDDAIWARASALPPAARRVLAGLAIAGAPIAREVALELAGLAGADAEAALDRLVHAQLVRVHGPRKSDIVEPFHDRVTEAVLAHEPASELRGLHGQLGRSLEERGGALPDVLFGHFDAAGDKERATRYLVLAAEHALGTFAFGRAVELYRHALATLSPMPRQRSMLLGQLAEALANTGQLAEAAQRDLDAAALAEPDSGQQLDLLRRAAERFLMSGRLEPGLETAKQVLARVNMTLPSRLRTLAGIAWQQVQTRGSALAWEKRSELDPRSRDADICWSIGAGLAMVDTLHGAYFSGKAGVLALRYGTPLQITRALSGLTVSAALMGRRARAQRFLDAALRAADDDGSPLASWYARTTACTTAFLVDNAFRRCFEMASALETDWYAAGGGQGWETDVVRHFALASQQMLGELGALAIRADEQIASSQRTGDLFQEVTLRVRFAVRHLISDRAADAEADVNEALAAWQPGATQFGNQRAWALWSLTRVLLYARDFGRLAPATGDDWQRMRRALIGRVTALKPEWYHAYGTYLLGLALAARASGNASEQAAHLRAAKKLSRALDRLKFPAAPAVARMLDAGIACVRANGDIIGPLRIALDAATARDVLVFAPFLKLRLGTALGGDEGAALVEAATAEATAQGWQDPRAGMQLVLPGE